MITQLTQDIDWIHECHDVDGRHIHSSTYVIHAAEGDLLVDTGDLHYQDQVLLQIDQVTDGSGIDGLFVSKSHLPHAANVSAISDRWPEVEVVFPGGIHNVHGFPAVTQWPHQGTNEWFGREFETTRGPLIDLDHTTWLFDRDARVFFTIDGCCSYHADHECDLLSNERSRPFELSDIQDFYRDILVWLQYSNPDKVLAGMDAVFKNKDIDYVAPGHGNPIYRDDLSSYMDILDEAIRDLAESRTQASAK